MTRKHDFVCPCCGKGSELPPSVLIMQGNYGSAEHDTERATVKLCGICYDQLYKIIQNSLTNRNFEIVFLCRRNLYHEGLVRLAILLCKNPTSNNFCV